MQRVTGIRHPPEVKPMLNNLLFSINTVLPVFLVILIGFYMKKMEYLDDFISGKINAILINFSIPVMFFSNMVNADLENIMDIKFISFAVITTLITFGVAWVFSLIFVRKRKQIGAFVQGCFNGNYVFIGFPVMANIIGGEAPEISLAVITFVVPIYNILSVAILSIYSEEKRSFKDAALLAVKNIVSNPLIRGLMLGLVFLILGIKLPQSIQLTCDYLASVASPLALLCIGANISMANVSKTVKPAMLAVLLKLVILPAIFIPLAVYMNFPSESIVVLYVMHAVPAAVSSYTLATMLGSDGELASNIVLLTSLFSIFTFTVGVFMLRSAGIV
jgi:predicted permease